MMTRPVLWSLGVVAVLAVVLASPFSLALYLGVGAVDWRAAAAVGGTFSMASAILSGAALVGVATSLYLQAQQARVAQVQAIRSMHFELVKMVMDDPDKYAKFWGFSRGDTERAVRDGYLNQVLNYTKAGFDLELQSAEGVRLVATDLFSSDVGRRYWEARRESWLVESSGRADKRFFTIIDEAYAAAVDR